MRPDSELSVSVPATALRTGRRGHGRGDRPRRRRATCPCATPCTTPPRAPGQRLAGASADLDDALERAGLEPTPDGDETVLGTCPFHRLARENPAVVCELNHAMLCGMAEAVGDDPGRVHLDAGSGGCCIRITAAP